MDKSETAHRTDRLHKVEATGKPDFSVVYATRLEIYCAPQDRKSFWEKNVQHVVQRSVTFFSGTMPQQTPGYLFEVEPTVFLQLK
jgi:hypothetical protein